jgi:phosphoadenosine phosphosulfate reductase
MLRYTDITGKDIDKVKTAIERLKAFEPNDGYYLAFSGGKDSCCIKALADMAGVRYDAHYSVTTVDPPELVRFIKEKHPDVIFNRPVMSMRKLIVKHLMLPTRVQRYCCKSLKEANGKGRIVMTGVRWAESNRRKAKHGIASVGKQGETIILNDDNDESRRMVENCYRTQKTMVNPIVDWMDEDVWEFIRTEKLPYCCLYDEGFKRLGCVGCPGNQRNARGAYSKGETNPD